MTTRTVASELSIANLERSHASLKEIGARINRSLLTQLVLSVVLILLSSGLASASQTIELLGLELEIPSWLLLTCASACVALLQAYGFRLMWYEGLLHQQVDRFEEALGYRDKHLQEDLPYGIQDPSAINILLTPVKGQGCPAAVASLAFVAILFCATFLLPVAAEALAMRSVINFVGCRWWVVLPHTVIILVSLLAVLQEIDSSPRRQEDSSE